jgi:hypothetical protein
MDTYTSEEKLNRTAATLLSLLNDGPDEQPPPRVARESARLALRLIVDRALVEQRDASASGPDKSRE